jgi:hypothetical protein
MRVTAARLRRGHPLGSRRSTRRRLKPTELNSTSLHDAEPVLQLSNGRVAQRRRLGACTLPAAAAAAAWRLHSPVTIRLPRMNRRVPRAARGNLRVARSTVAGASTPAPPIDELIRLSYELLDAHADTAELADDMSVTSIEWRNHLDYLRDLQRLGRETLARSDPGVG